MARVQASPSPLQAITSFFLTADLAVAAAALEIATTIVETRQVQLGGDASLLEQPAVPAAPPAGDGRSIRRRSKRGLPPEAHELAGMAVPVAAVAPELPAQTSEDE